MADRLEPKIALIGASPIAQFHISALKAVGLKITHISASYQSKRAREVAAAENIKTFWDDPIEMVNNAEYDAIIIASPIAQSISYLTLACERNVPILVEKPVTVYAEDFAQLDLNRDDIFVAYNRRFYPGIQKLKQGLSKPNRNAVLVSAVIPEVLNLNLYDKRSRYYPALANTIHVIDLLRFILGDLSVSFKMEKYIRNEFNFVLATLVSGKGDIVDVQIPFNSSINTGIVIHSNTERIELSPIETLKIYNGMTIENPSSIRTFRSYKPELTLEERTDPMEDRFKPGFILQAEAFKDLITNGTKHSGLVSLLEASKSLVLTEEILGLR